MLTDFQLRVFALVRTVPPGRITTYGEVARAAGSIGAARAVGQCMRTNPFAPDSACSAESVVP
jgi:methylated-DNA-[protein]-cysteine S-methyltransferase